MREGEGGGLKSKVEKTDFTNGGGWWRLVGAKMLLKINFIYSDLQRIDSFVFNCQQVAINMCFSWFNSHGYSRGFAPGLLTGAWKTDGKL